MTTWELTLVRVEDGRRTEKCHELSHGWPLVAKWLKARNEYSSAGIDLMTLMDGINKAIAGNPVPLAANCDFRP